MNPTSRILCLAMLLTECLLVAGCHPSADRVISPAARAASQPIPVNEVDDAAIWLHPDNPRDSLLLLANERRGLEVHNMDGILIKNVDDGLRPNNVDLVYEFPLAGTKTDLALAACFDPEHMGVRIWSINPDKRKLYDATEGYIIKVFDGGEVLGLCTYRSHRSGRSYFFVTARDGRIEQYELTAASDGLVSARRVRAFALSDKTEGCVADEERGVVYFAEENVGIWRFPAEPDAEPVGTCVTRVGEHGLIPDVEGLALYCAPGGRGYLLAVSQGPKGGRSCIKVYDRQGDNAFILTIVPSSQPFGPLERASGLAVTNRPTIPEFPLGVLVINDHINPSASEDFKIYAWEDIARPGGLIIDTGFSPRPSDAENP